VVCDAAGQETGLILSAATSGSPQADVADVEGTTRTPTKSMRDKINNNVKIYFILVFSLNCQILF